MEYDTMVCQCGFNLSRQGVNGNPSVPHCDDPCEDFYIGKCDICQDDSASHTQGKGGE